MLRDFNQDDLELFVKQKADQYKIYPSDKVWKGIFLSIHSKGKWFTLGGSLLLISALFFISQEVVFPGRSNANVKGKRIEHKAQIKAFQPTSSASNTSPVSNSTRKSLTGSLKTHSTAKNIAPVYVIPAVPALPETRQSGSEAGPALISSGVVTLKDRSIVINPPVATSPVLAGNDIADNSKLVNTEVSADVALIGPIEEGNLWETEVNWLQEMAAIKLAPAKKSPFNLQFYFSPTISYRRLVDNKTSLYANQQVIPLASNHQNVDRFVDHKPSIGVELGSNILFAAGKNLTIKTGLQLNYSRYNIKAYKFYFEKASIALNAVGRVADTITPYTSIRNFSGYYPEDLQNQYLQISVPVGAELKVLGNKRFQFNIAGTVQPTYLLFNDIYLLSTDYVNYAKEPSLVRKWNVHTSVEAFVSYKLGGIRWQVGPQFRYQLMSSYTERYPIKEYLMEYGVKFGISKTLK